MKLKYGLISYGFIVLLLIILVSYESTYQSITYYSIAEFNKHENRSFLRSFAGLPKLFLFIALYGGMMYFFGKILGKIDDKAKPKRTPEKYEYSGSPEAWKKLPKKYRTQMLEYYKKKREGLK